MNKKYLLRHDLFFNAVRPPCDVLPNDIGLKTQLDEHLDSLLQELLGAEQASSEDTEKVAK